MDFNNQKLQKKMGEALEDRISELPDSILHYILSSFLYIKDVARTCVLSRRWKQIWTTIPTLDFRFWDEEDPPSLSEINKFMDFVDRTLFLHHQSSILKFKLDLYNNMNASRVHSWLEYLTSVNVQKLSLSVGLDQDIPLSIPVSLFTCESLTKLKLSQGPSNSMHFPRNISLLKLKSLTLSRIQFGNNSCWNEQPFSSCPVLEELILNSCTWFGLKKFYILTPLLKVLEISNACDNVGNILEHCDLKIHAPGLISLNWRGCVGKDYDMSNFLALDDADVMFFTSIDKSGRGEQRISHVVRKFLRALSHVRCLSLYVSRTQVLSIPDDFVSSLPTFHNLNSLDLHHGATSDMLIFAMLKVAPMMECLVFSLGDYSCDGDKEYDKTEDLFRHLQSVRFVEFSGTRRESRWAKLILKYAESLQTLTIEYGCPFFVTAPKSKEVVMSELLSYRRASKRCRVKFV